MLKDIMLSVPWQFLSTIEFCKGRPLCNKCSDRNMRVSLPVCLGKYVLQTSRPTNRQIDQHTDIRIHRKHFQKDNIARCVEQLKIVDTCQLTCGSRLSVRQRQSFPCVCLSTGKPRGNPDGLRMENGLFKKLVRNEFLVLG